MKINPNIELLSVIFPEDNSEVPENLLHTPLAKDFKKSSGFIPLLEQYAKEEKPHRFRHINIQYGNINGRRAVKIFLDREPMKLVYSHEKDPYIEEFFKDFPPKVIPPSGCVPSSLARTFREIALKWVAERFFDNLTPSFLSFDEPIIHGVNPDLLCMPTTKAHEILTMAHKHGNSEKNLNPHQNLVEMKLDDALFVEIKAFHGDTTITEKEILQSFNYANFGGKALLLTTGHFGEYDDTFSILNEASEKHKETKEGYDEESYEAFKSAVKKKYGVLQKNLDMRRGQDSWDNKGIYLSAHKKIKTLYKYTQHWHHKVEYKWLETPEQILDFINKSKDEIDLDVNLGLIRPDAFVELCDQLNLPCVGELFQNIRNLTIEEIMIEPYLLYPNLDIMVKKN